MIALGKFFWKHKDGLGWWCQREDKGNRYKKRSQKYFTKKYAKVTEVSWHESTPTPPSRPGLACAGECCRALKPYKSILLSLLMGFPPLCFSLDFGDVSLSPLYWVFPWLCSVECGLFILGISITPSKTEYSTCNVTPSPIPYLPFHPTSAAMQSSLPYSVSAITLKVNMELTGQGSVRLTMRKTEEMTILSYPCCQLVKTTRKQIQSFSVQ